MSVQQHCSALVMYSLRIVCICALFYWITVPDQSVWAAGIKRYEDAAYLLSHVCHIPAIHMFHKSPAKSPDFRANTSRLALFVCRVNLF
jgi:hypothetical protein